jgi:hypothetical protein
MVGERRFELPASWSRTKRATKLRYSPIKFYKYKICVEMSRGNRLNLVFGRKASEMKWILVASRPLRASSQSTARRDPWTDFLEGKSAQSLPPFVSSVGSAREQSASSYLCQGLQRSPSFPIP